MKSYSDSFPAPVTNFAHVFTSTPIQDTANWTTISSSFIADSAHQYIIIGNFFDDANTTFIIMNSSSNCYSYYYLDDICVSTDSMTCNGITTINENKNASETISIFPNPTNGNAIIEFILPQGESKAELIIYTIAGAEVKRVAVTNGSSKIELDNSALQSGTYFYQLITSKGIVGSKKMVVVK